MDTNASCHAIHFVLGTVDCWLVPRRACLKGVSAAIRRFPSGDPLVIIWLEPSRWNTKSAINLFRRQGIVDISPVSSINNAHETAADDGTGGKISE